MQNLSSFILRRLARPDPTSNFEIFLVADTEQVSTNSSSGWQRPAGKNSRLFGMPDLLNAAQRDGPAGYP